MKRFFMGDIVRDDALEGEVPYHDIDADEVCVVVNGAEVIRKAAGLELVEPSPWCG